MKVEIYLTPRKNKGMFRAEFYIEGHMPQSVISQCLNEYETEKVADLIVNFYNALKLNDILIKVDVEVGNKWIGKKVFEDIKKQIEKRIK